MSLSSSRWIPLGSVSADKPAAYLSLDVPRMDHLMITWRLTGTDGTGVTGDIPVMFFNNDIFRNDQFFAHTSRPPNWSYYYWDGVSFFPASWDPVLVNSSTSISFSHYELMGHMAPLPSVCAGVLFVSNLKNESNKMRMLSTSKGAHFVSTDEFTGHTAYIWNEAYFDMTGSISTRDTSLPISCSGMGTRPWPSFNNPFYTNNEQIGKIVLATYYSFYGTNLNEGSGFSVFGYNLR